MRAFNPYQTALPITEILPEVRKELQQANHLIVAAAPGAGKSTVLPLALLDEPWLDGKKIVLLEPRRLAASSVAARMAALLHERVGETVGYRIRFENKVSSKTRLEVVTEGILTRMLQSDNALEEVGLVIFDEFHERSIHADLALAFCLETQQVLRPDLKLLIMSATLDLHTLPAMLNCPVIESQGRAYPVDIVYTGEQDSLQIPELTVRTIARALREQEGDILVFLPGQAEIRRCEDMLNRQLKEEVVYPLYGTLAFADQQAALLPHPSGKRKIVLATSIAETSLTIEGVRIVIDSGFVRKPQFDAKTGLSGLRTLEISLDSAGQRAGRAGRLSAGVCYRMWSKATESRMAAYRTPEIVEADLSPLLLDLYKWGITQFTSLQWLTVPPQSNIQSASELLEELGAVKNGKITPLGKQVHQLPCHPRIGNMLIRAAEEGILNLATDLAALLEERDPLDAYAGADINLRIEGLRRYRTEKRSERRWEAIEKVAAAHRRLFAIPADNGVVPHYQTGKLLAFAYPERIATAKTAQPGQYQLANGKTAVMDKSDELANETWLTIAHLDARKGGGRIFLAAPLNASDLYHLARENDVVQWDTRKGGLLAARELKLGSLVLRSTPFPDVREEQIARVVSDAIRIEGDSLLDFTDEVLQWQNRIASLKCWNPESAFPDVSKASLLAHNEEWLSWDLAKIRKAEDLRKLNLAQLLKQSLAYELQLDLDKLAPESIVVPSGSAIKLEYFPQGEPPVLAVRLQEVFGMLETPRLNNGRTGVVLHLLSPGFKPVQVTSDLRSFWSNAYFEVRKELKRRYPKHSWPENPLEAEAVRGVKRKMA